MNNTARNWSLKAHWTHQLWYWDEMESLERCCSLIIVFPFLLLYIWVTLLKVSKVLKSFQDMQHRLLCLIIILLMIFSQTGVMARYFLILTFIQSWEQLETSIWAAATVALLIVFISASTLTYSTLHYVQDQRVKMLLKLSKKEQFDLSFPVLRHLTVLWPCSSTPWPELTALEKNKRKKKKNSRTKRSWLWLCFVVVTAESTQWWGDKTDGWFPAVFYSLKQRATQLT